MTINKLDTKGWWAVDGTPIYTPAINTQVDSSNVAGSSSGRDEAGIMHIEWKRRDVTKVYLRYGAMTASELQYMKSLMQGKEFVFTFRDEGKIKNINAYVGEMTRKFYSYALGEEIYKDVQINVIEK